MTPVNELKLMCSPKIERKLTTFDIVAARLSVTGSRLDINQNCSFRSLSAAREESKVKKATQQLSQRDLKSNEELLSEIETIVNTRKGFTESKSEADISLGFQQIKEC